MFANSDEKVPSLTAEGNAVWGGVQSQLPGITITYLTEARPKNQFIKHDFF